MDRRRPTIDDSVNLEILPWGATKEDLDAAAAKKEKAWRGCLIPFALIALAIVYIAGYVAGAYKGL